MKWKYFNVFFLIIILLAVIIFSDKGMAVMKYLVSRSETSSDEKTTVIIDAGHGGIDPGKVGINNALEKEINLSIAFKVKKLLEEENVIAIMTRESDMGLYSETDRNKKSADMRERVRIINESTAACTVSIHQNSFQEPGSKGAQVFYHAQSEEGRKLAEILQEQIKATINDGNHREAKSNSSYYMLKNTNCPLVIAECGFLSNPEEAELLCNEEYQEKMALAIHMGIMKYLAQRTE